MPTTPYDSAIFRDLFGDAEVAKLFTDSADIRAMLLVEGALAKAQGALGVIPETAAAAIHRASLEVLIDPGVLSAETGQSAVVVPALVRAFRDEMQAPEHSQFIHWGATSQDIIETGQVLRLRQVLAIFESRLEGVIAVLAVMANEHAELPMAARTYGQVATVTSFGAVVAGWGQPLLRLLDRLGPVRDALLTVSLSGAAGTLSAMGPKGPEVRARMAEALGLSDPGGSWHAERDRLTGLAGWMTQVGAQLGKIGEDLLAMTQSGVNEVRLGSTGGSSSMPQKNNPVQPSLLVALGRQLVALNGAMQGAAMHRQQRDGAAWFTEWLSLPQMCLGLGRGLSVTQEMLAGLSPDAKRMAAMIDDGRGLIYAEALSFELAKSMPRPKAQAEVKALCAAVSDEFPSLTAFAAARWPGQSFAQVFDPLHQMGTAPSEARAFGAKVRRPKG